MPEAKHRFTALDSMRGVAAIGVLLHHMPASNGLAALPVARMGSLFVDFFFVLSGVVIACSYGDKLAAGFLLRKFAVPRLGRVLPVHLVMIALFAAMECAAWALGSGGFSLRPVFTGTHSPAHLFTAIFLLDGYFPNRQNSFNGVTWSISVELFLYASAAFAYRRRGGLWLLALAGIGAFVLRALWITWPVLTTDLQRGLIGFAAGTLCWELFRRRGDKILPAATLIEALSLAAMFLFVWFSMRFLHPEFVFLPAAAVVLVFAHQGGALSRLLSTRWPVWLGAISYSLYMTHVMVLGRAADVMLLAARLTGRPLASYGYVADIPIKSIDLPLLPALAVQFAIIAAALVVAHWCCWLIEEPARQWSRRYAATL